MCETLLASPLEPNQRRPPCSLPDRWRMVAEAFAVMGSFFELSTVLLPGHFLVRTAAHPPLGRSSVGNYSPRD